MANTGAAHLFPGESGVDALFIMRKHGVDTAA
jgi:hypothetical protein